MDESIQEQESKEHLGSELALSPLSVCPCPRLFRFAQELIEDNVCQLASKENQDSKVFYHRHIMNYLYIK